MLALWASPQINFFKRKKRKKESHFNWWQGLGCQGFWEKSALEDFVNSSRH